MSRTEQISIKDKLDSFIEMYENTFGQTPTAVLLSREQLREYMDFKRSLALKDPMSYAQDPVKPLSYNGVLIQLSQKQRIEDERKELEELRKLKDSLNLIKDVLKV